MINGQVTNCDYFVTTLLFVSCLIQFTISVFSIDISFPHMHELYCGLDEMDSFGSERKSDPMIQTCCRPSKTFEKRSELVECSTTEDNLPLSVILSAFDRGPAREDAFWVVRDGHAGAVRRRRGRRRMELPAADHDVEGTLGR